MQSKAVQRPTCLRVGKLHTTESLGRLVTDFLQSSLDVDELKKGAKQSDAKQSKAMQSKATQSKATISESN